MIEIVDVADLRVAHAWIILHGEHEEAAWMAVSKFSVQGRSPLQVDTSVGEDLGLPVRPAWTLARAAA